MFKKVQNSILILLGSFVAFPLFFIVGLYFNWFGLPLNSGEILNLKDDRVLPIEESYNDAKQILFGDLHVHSSFSLDAYLLNLPLLQGEGVHPISDACDYARFCSNIDFWSINDHAAWLTPREWKQTIKGIDNCNQISSKTDESEVIAFLGWEWTQRSVDPNDHYGHKNIIIKSIDPQEIPKAPIAADRLDDFNSSLSSFILQSTALVKDFKNRDLIFDLRYKQLELSSRIKCSVTNIQRGCSEVASTPEDLFKKLDKISSDILVIPHGTSWGNSAPPLASWTNQISPSQNDNNVQRLIEVYSGHGNSEEYRSWRSLYKNLDSTLECPSPASNFLPSCFRAGEIIRERCLFSAGSEEECNSRALEARRNYLLSNPLGHLSVPGQEPEEWLDAGQCKDCFLPAFNYRPGMSVQHALALSDFSQEEPFRLRFGFIGSSDNHQAKPGNGYKEVFRLGITNAKGPLNEDLRLALKPRSMEPAIPRSISVDPNVIIAKGNYPKEEERGSSFFLSGGLVGVHAALKNRDSIWESLNNREVYATSGDRILLWFNYISNNNDIYPMGSEVKSKLNPTFEVKVLGAFKQNPGCAGNQEMNPDIARRISNLCKGECFNPSDERKLISRLEVVRIRPQIYPNEPVESLIQDPWKVIPCDDKGEGCTVKFQDLQFENGTREVIYYVRAIQEPSDAINAKGLGCELDREGNCLKTDICYGDYRGISKGDCLGETEERAWSSPIFVSYESLVPQP